MLRLRKAAAYSASAMVGAHLTQRARLAPRPLPAETKPGSLFSTPPYQKEPTMSIDVSKEKLAADLKVVVADAEELLRATASQAGDKVGVARERIQASLASARVKLADTERAVLDKTKIAAKATDCSTLAARATRLIHLAIPPGKSVTVEAALTWRST